MTNCDTTMTNIIKIQTHRQTTWNTNKQTNKMKPNRKKIIYLYLNIAIVSKYLERYLLRISIPSGALPTTTFRTCKTKHVKQKQRNMSSKKKTTCLTRTMPLCSSTYIERYLLCIHGSSGALLTTILCIDKLTKQIKH